MIDEDSACGVALLCCWVVVRGHTYSVTEVKVSLLLLLRSSCFYTSWLFDLADLASIINYWKVTLGGLFPKFLSKLPVKVH